MSVNNQRWLVFFLLIALVACFWWGSGQARLQRDYAVRLENNYQRAFHELVWHIATVENELAKLTVAATPQQHMEKLATVWRQIYAATEKLGQLPLGLVSLENIENYLASAGEQIFALVCQGPTASEKDNRQIMNLQNGAAALTKELASLQEKVLGDNLRWTEVERAVSDDKRSRDNVIASQLGRVDGQAEGYPEVQLDQRIGVAPPSPRIEGAVISAQEAQQRALWFLSPADNSGYRVVAMEETKGIIPTYSFTIAPPQSKENIRVEITRSLGRVLWMLDGRADGKPSALTIAALENRAQEFLRQRGFKEMQLVGRHDYAGSVLFAYVYKQDGVLIYPDLLRVRVAMDEGRVVGFEGNGYATWHKVRRLAEPKVTMEEALEALAEGVELIAPVQQAIIFNAASVEVLVYEFAVRYGGDDFLIYVDAMNGEEVQIVRLESQRLPAEA